MRRGQAAGGSQRRTCAATIATAAAAQLVPALGRRVERRPSLARGGGSEVGVGELDGRQERVAVDGGGGAAHERAAAEDALDLTKLEPQPAQLHLAVGAADDFASPPSHSRDRR